MKLYADEDSASRHLLRALSQAGHDVQRPHDVQLLGRPDPVHLLHCIQTHRVLISQNHDDFDLLHNLVIQSGGQHPGIFAIRKDNSPHDMKPPHIVRAISRLLAAGTSIANQFIVLNHWR
jgi:uncharacterized protein DUF5615